MPSTGAPEDVYVSTMATCTNDGKAVKKCNSSNLYINESVWANLGELLSSLFFQLLDLSESLHLYWPSIKCPQNDGKSSWTSIWKTFGVCTNLSEHDYFEKALQIRTDVNVLRILEDNGIVPDGSNYSLASIQQALDNGIGQKVAIQCSKIYNTSLYQLFRIFFCVDKSDASTIVSCPFVSKYKCPDEVVFSHFDVGMLKGFTVLDSGPESYLYIWPSSLRSWAEHQSSNILHFPSSTPSSFIRKTSKQPP
ncbi:Intracellular ribonuclease LX [Nymphaea thermarum]|nr:Intracellular ribonuclease LX [Nymphaea thermarum]